MTVTTRQGVSDAAVIEQSWREPGVFAALYERHAPHISRYVARRLGDDLADDVTAETFYRAFEKRRHYDLGRPDARPWLYGIAANVMAQHHRKETRMLRAFARSGADPVAQTYGSQMEGADDRVVAAGMHRSLAAALAGLSRAHREVLLLIAWADLSYEEAAQALDISVGTVRSRLHRARTKIRAVLGGENPMSVSDSEEG
ncbi:DNA-directed RNA polymerase sigma-70 factor [Planotetraspora thailandica]|uniref:DNA-directed RNA polymerase sigma-70 factor n=1 Tax=Planotetraspora thailandica TaxID=487172 RepID=A0A8J3Y0P0_9ACTN|nr:RNA polymerase sigma factor [Planotetraspora thailandica]GII58617.1 DNA-directed RNA polymerase sigma-70 factor [Planotetraspora thailandica]